jgi:transcriptional regulator with XRE-family HTH domain
LASGTKIKETREQLGVKVLELSQATGISTPDLVAIEKGDRQPSGDEVIALADFFQVNPTQFYGEQDSDRYRGNHGPVGSPITGNDFNKHHDQEAKKRELSVLRNWVQTASMRDVHESPRQLKRLQELELELTGRSTYSDAFTEAHGSGLPSAHTTVADLRREQAEQQRQRLADAGGAVPNHSWRVE